MRDRGVGAAATALDRVMRPKRAIRRPDDSRIKRILVIKPCCLGDLLMATPAIRALNMRFPEAAIDVLTNDWTAPALAYNPRIAEVLAYPARTTPAQLLATSGWLKKRRYDLGIALDRSPTVSLLLRMARIPVRAGVDNNGRGIGLTHRIVPRPFEHETELYLRVVESIGVRRQGLEPEYSPSPALDAQAAALLPSDDERFVVLHPGGAINPGVTMISKRWPPDRYGALATRLKRELGVEVVLVGAASDRDAIIDVKADAGVPLIDLSEQIDFPTLAAVIARARLYIGNDSGAGHLAAAVGTPQVSIFGPTSPLRYRPLGKRAVVCAPAASWDTDQGDLRKGVAIDWLRDIRQVHVDEVFDTCVALLESDDRTSPA